MHIIFVKYSQCFPPYVIIVLKYYHPLRTYGREQNMGNQLVYLLLGSIITVSLINLIMFVTRSKWKERFNEISLSFILASLCGFTITIIPTMALVIQGVIELSSGNILPFLLHCLYSLTLFFITFLIMGFFGKKKINADHLQKRNVHIHLILSVVVSSFILVFTYYITLSHTPTLILKKDNSFYSLLLLIGTIYTTIRIFEHIQMDQSLLGREVSLIKNISLFTMISIAICSVVYCFIDGLFLHNSFLMNTIEASSVLLLFLITITYIEDQFTHQQEKLKEKHTELKVQEQHYRSLFDYNPDAIYTLDLKGNFTAFNPSAVPLTGYSLEELYKRKIKDLIVPEEIPYVLEKYENVKQGNTANFETAILTKDHTIVNLDITAFTIKVDNKITGVYGIAQDITAEKQAQEQIEYLAYHDELTGLLNRRRIKNEMESLIEKDGEQLATIVIDVDLFKDINDHLGHTYGDHLLQLVAKRMQEAIGERGFIARLGGDEFLICIPSIENHEEVRNEITSIQDSMKDIFILGEYYKEISLSIGVSFYPKDGKDFNTLIRHADMAMYEVKRDGRDSYMEYSPSFAEKNVSKIVLFEDLKKAIEENQLLLHFQPKYGLAHNQIEGVETLVRWKHPEKGMISPGEFIPLAEESDLIIQLGNWILKEACYQYKVWEQQSYINFHLSINISPKQFLHPDFTDNIIQVLEETGMSPLKLDLEITESLAIENTESTIEKIQILKQYGIQISMDDFGTGYTSLSYLSMFPLDRIKIDRSFIQYLPDNKDHKTIVQSILTVAKNLNIRVTAEGVETQAQLALLHQLQCEEVQGFYFSKPVPPDSLLAHWNAQLMSM